jgi:hypothetical protein
VTPNPTVPLKVLYTHWQQSQRPLPSISVLYRYLRRQGLDRKNLGSGGLETGPTKAFDPIGSRQKSAFGACHCVS